MLRTDSAVWEGESFGAAFFENISVSGGSVAGALNLNNNLSKIM
jgi:hypothetical protein